MSSETLRQPASIADSHGLPPAPAFAAAYAPADEEIAARLMAQASRPADAEFRIDRRAGALIEAIRSRTGRLGGIEDFLHAYSLSPRRASP